MQCQTRSDASAATRKEKLEGLPDGLPRARIGTPSIKDEEETMYKNTMKSAIWLSGLMTVALVAPSLHQPASAANVYAETFLHLKPATADLGEFELDLHVEDEQFKAYFAETLPVNAIRMVMQTDHPAGLSKQHLSSKAAEEYGTVAIKMIVGVEPADYRSPGNLTGQFHCQAVSAPKSYNLSGVGLLCPTGYDAGDAGEFFVEPVFGDAETTSSFRAHFRVVSQKTLDRKGTPDGKPFIGALLNGHQSSLEMSAGSANEEFRNARPLLRLKDLNKPLVLGFTSYEKPGK